MSTTVEFTPELLQALVSSSRNFDEWKRGGERLSQLERKRQEFIGDWLLAGEVFGAKSYDAAERIFKNYTRASLRNMAAVAKAVPASLRNDDLTWNHYCAVAKLPTVKKEEWLRRAVSEEIPAKKLRRLINHPSESEPKKQPEVEPKKQPEVKHLFTDSVWMLMCEYASKLGVEPELLVRQICEPAIVQWTQNHPLTEAA